MTKDQDIGDPQVEPSPGCPSGPSSYLVPDPPLGPAPGTLFPYPHCPPGQSPRTYVVGRDLSDPTPALCTLGRRGSVYVYSYVLVGSLLSQIKSESEVSPGPKDTGDRSLPSGARVSRVVVEDPQADDDARFPVRP